MLLILLGAGAWGLLRASMPVLAGEHELAGLQKPVVVERDDLGVPTLRASNLNDLARATGYVHAQDRFFQMDLLRRSAAGEMSVLFGKRALNFDRSRRLHRLRHVAAEIIARSSPDQRDLIRAYVDGVNAGVDALSARPFEYLLLRTTPQPWRDEDTVLVALAMYLDLHDENAHQDAERGRLARVLPAQMVDFIYPAGSQWDAPIEGPAFAPDPPPAARVYDLRAIAMSVPRPEWPEPTAGLAISDDDHLSGSSNWALAGGRTANGRALLANDMHLGLRVPAVWYRARLIIAGGTEASLNATGVTLPGTPLMIAGSNGHIAWGLTNSYGDWSDRVILEMDPADSNRYRTPDGWRDIEIVDEIIEVRGSKPVTEPIRQSIWGPVVQTESGPQAVLWLAHSPDATNFELLRMAYAIRVSDALRIAPDIGIPPQNLVVVDHQGNIGWTIAGRIPLRRGYDPLLPSAWVTDGVGWVGWLGATQYPRVLNPDSGQIWTANARVVGPPDLALLGDGGYALGARATQIRDDLDPLIDATPADFLAIQLDDRALFLGRWRDLALRLLDDTGSSDDRRARAGVRLEQWTGRAGVDSDGYLIVREFRQAVTARTKSFLVFEARLRDPDYEPRLNRRFEAALWQLITDQPIHFLDPDYGSWDRFLQATLDEVLARLDPGNNGEFETWGQHNVASITHPMASSIPVLGRELNMPAIALPGDTYMPRVQARSFGASERFAVAPGAEDQAYFELPGGQSGHPLSPFYRSEFEAWARGEPTPFLPGERRYELRLVPSP